MTPEISGVKRLNSISVRLGSNVGHKKGGVFTELADIPTAPLAREMIHGLSSILGPRAPDEDSMSQMGTGGSVPPLKRQYSSTAWLVLTGTPNEESVSDISDTEESTSDIPSAKLQESLKAKAVW